MRFGVLTQFYPPEMGAPQARLSELASRVQKAGHEVVVLTALPNYPSGRVFEGYGGLFRRDRVDDIPVLRSYIYPDNSLGVRQRLLHYASFVVSSAVVGTSSLPQLDFLMTETPPLFLAASGWYLARLKRARWILNISDLWIESAVRLGAIGQGSALRSAQAFDAFVCRHADLITCQSEGIVMDVKMRFPDVPTYHLSNGVDTDRFKPDLGSEAIRQQLVGDAHCLAVYAGLHGMAQGLDQLLEAARQLADVDGFRMAFVGDGPERERLIRLAHDLGLSNVVFLGARPRDEIPALLASADIALVPLKEHLPGAVPSKLYEAMASGRAVVLVADGEPAEIVTSTGAGLTVAPGDVSGLAAAIRRLADDPGLRSKLGSAGRCAATERFSRDRIVADFIAYLEHVGRDRSHAASAR